MGLSGDKEQTNFKFNEKTCDTMDVWLSRTSKQILKMFFSVKKTYERKF